MQGFRCKGSGAKVQVQGFSCKGAGKGVQVQGFNSCMAHRHGLLPLPVGNLGKRALVIPTAIERAKRGADEVGLRGRHMGASACGGAL